MTGSDSDETVCSQEQLFKINRSYRSYRRSQNSQNYSPLDSIRKELLKHKGKESIITPERGHILLSKLSKLRCSDANESERASKYAVLIKHIIRNPTNGEIIKKPGRPPKHRKNSFSGIDVSQDLHMLRRCNDYMKTTKISQEQLLNINRSYRGSQNPRNNSPLVSIGRELLRHKRKEKIITLERVDILFSKLSKLRCSDANESKTASKYAVLLKNINRNPTRERGHPAKDSKTSFSGINVSQDLNMLKKCNNYTKTSKIIATDEIASPSTSFSEDLLSNLNFISDSENSTSRCLPVTILSDQVITSPNIIPSTVTKQTPNDGFRKHISFKSNEDAVPGATNTKSDDQESQNELVPEFLEENMEILSATEELDQAGKDSNFSKVKFKVEELFSSLNLTDLFEKQVLPHDKPKLNYFKWQEDDVLEVFPESPDEELTESKSVAYSNTYLWEYQEILREIEDSDDSLSTL